MPLSKIQTDILKLLASHRDPESYVAGSTPLNREAPRYSGDIDVFHDREELVARAAAEDAAVLAGHGYTLQWQRREPAIYTVLVRRSGQEQSWNGSLIAISVSFPQCGTRCSAMSCTRLTLP